MSTARIGRHLPRPLALAAIAVMAACTAAPGGAIQPGSSYRGEGTFYQLSSMGNCSYPEYPGNGQLFAAMNELDYGGARLCGAEVLVRDERTQRAVSVTVVDRCPECKPGDIDLGAAAFAQIAAPVDGRVPITWSLVAAPVTGNVRYRVKTGSSEYWMGIQALNHRWPVERLEIQTGDGGWQSLKREAYNYFVAPSGLGQGRRSFTVRLTDIRGQSLVHADIGLQPDVVQTASSQFP